MDINEIIRMSKDKSVQENQDKILLEPHIYIQKNPSKHNRSKILRAFNHWLNIPEDKLQLIREIVETLHDSSLLIDDILDNSTIRRGNQTAHSIYGVGNTINAACYAGYMALEKTLLLNHPEAVSIFTEEMIESHRGQGIEIYWRDIFIVPTELEYKLMAVQKKGGLIRMIIRLMQLFSANQNDFSKLTLIIALHLQIVDDYSSMSGKDNDGGKGFCEDLTEGKFSFPVIHAIRNQKCNSEVLNILRQRTSDVELKKYCTRLLVELGSLKYTRDVLELLNKQAREEVKKLGPNPLMEALLDDMISWSASSDNN